MKGLNTPNESAETLALTHPQLHELLLDELGARVCHAMVLDNIGSKGCRRTVIVLRWLDAVPV